MARTTNPTPPLPPAAPDRTALPAERAFVVQLRVDADLARGHVRGRLEHLTSGIAALFESAEELVSRMHDAIRSRTPPSSREDTE